MLDAARNPIGPFDDEQLRQFVAVGTLKSNDLICDADGGTWVEAFSIRPTYFHAAPPPPPPLAPSPPLPQTPPTQIPANLPPSPTSSDVALGILIPVRVAPLALVAGYVGLFSLLVFPAPIALVLGIMALRRLKADPMSRGAGRAWFAIVAGAIGTFVLLAAMAASI